MVWSGVSESHPWRSVVLSWGIHPVADRLSSLVGVCSNVRAFGSNTCTKVQAQTSRLIEASLYQLLPFPMQLPQEWPSHELYTNILLYFWLLCAGQPRNDAINSVMSRNCAVERKQMTVAFTPLIVLLHRSRRNLISRVLCVSLLLNE